MRNIMDNLLTLLWYILGVFAQKIDLLYGIIDSSKVRVAMSILLQIVLPHWYLLFLLVQKVFVRFW